MNSNFKEKHDIAYKSYERIMDSFKSLKRSGEPEYIYPEYFGGTNINDEGNLVVYVKGSNNQKLETESLLMKKTITMVLSWSLANFHIMNFLKNCINWTISLNLPPTNYRTYTGHYTA